MHMKKYLLFLFGSLFVYMTSCNTDKVDNRLVKNTNCLNIRVTGDTRQLLQIDSIFSEFNIIQLETKNECLISQILKVILYADRIYIIDKIGKLFVFNINGRFLFEIGKKGRGPGEYIILRDFDIDKDGNIYILDFLKILKFDNDGTFKEKISFNFLSRNNKTYCNPLDFAVKSDGNFYLWGGSFGIDANPKSRLFAMYEMTKNGEIVNNYIPLKYSIQGGAPNHRFIHYQDMTLIDPIFGSNTVYSINKEGIEARYNIDFGNKTLNIPVPNSFKSLADFKMKVGQSYYHSIEGFNETKDWIYFRFDYKMRIHNVYYSKILKKSFLSSVYPYVAGRIAPWMIYSSYNEKFVTFMDSDYILEQINRCKAMDTTRLSLSEKKIIKRLAFTKPTDNPILFICSMRNY
jgi:hypothetical protein